MGYTTTPELLRTIAAVPTADADAPATTSSEPEATPTASGNLLSPRAIVALAVAAGLASFLI